MAHGPFVLALFAASIVFPVSGTVQADDDYVKGAKSLSAQDFDKTLPDQPIEEWLRAHIPAEYAAVWGEFVTDCGEGTGTAADQERDMPLCAEVQIKDGPRATGYLALFVGTHKRGQVKHGVGLYFGYLEHRGTKYDFKRLGDVLRVE